MKRFAAGWVLLLLGAAAGAVNVMADTEATTTTSESAGIDEARVDRPGRITLVRGNMAVERVLAEISAKSGVSVASRGKITGQRIDSLVLRDVPTTEAIQQIVNSIPNALLYQPADRPEQYEIWDQESFRMEVLPRLARPKTFRPAHINAEEAHKAIVGILTPNIGTAAYDLRSNKLFVTDLPPVLELAERLLEQIDVKFITRVFSIQHASVTDLAKKLDRMRSPAAPAAESDNRTRQIIVRDRLEILRDMELLVETLDVSTPDATGWRISAADKASILLQRTSDNQEGLDSQEVRLKLGESRTLPWAEDGQATVTLISLPVDKDQGYSEAVVRVSRPSLEIKLPVRPASSL